MAIQIIKEVTADVIKRGTTKSVYAKQNDFNSRFLNIRIQEEGQDIKVDKTSTVILNVERSDHKENMFYGTVNSDGTVKVPMSAWMLELAGTLVCDVSIVSVDPAEAKLTTMQFNIYVEAAVVSDGSFVESEDYSVIVDLLNKVGEMPVVTEEDNGKIMQVVDGALEVISLEESAVKTYIDDYISEALGGDY